MSDELCLSQLRLMMPEQTDKRQLVELLAIERPSQADPSPRVPIHRRNS